MSRASNPASNRERGVALPVVLLIVSMMLVTSAAWFEASLVEARQAAAVFDQLQSFHAADGALRLCARALIGGAAPMPAAPAQAGEPQQWRRQDTFEALATMPASTWPGSVRPPQCLVQAWRIETRPAVRAFLITARGFGAMEEAQSWLQLQLVVDGMRIERHWRRIVARPF
ncbi:hypothetical protein [Paraburkholderia sp. J67]|uniref:pilus assembly PilX family protein n=1 Tax=Paraburkholderia sp. J67 TaxID=2805435 RepID=UPI002ABD58B7|nr:hypothetical protein [Paraburkholderia sp. J67]